jgi:hypothetical protein
VLSSSAAEWPWEWQEPPPRPRAQVYALEGLGALGGFAGAAASEGYVGLLAGLVLAGPDWLGSGVGYDKVRDVWALVMLGVGAVAIPATTGYVTSRVGERIGESGTQTWAIAGAYAGVPVAAGLVLLGVGLSSKTRAAPVPLYVLGGLAIPAGAVVGYNLGIKRDAPLHGSRVRFEAPSVGLTRVEQPDRSLEYGVKVQLVGLKL